MEPLVALLLELGARAKTAEGQLLERDKVIADQQAKLDELTKAAEKPKE